MSINPTNSNFGAPMFEVSSNAKTEFNYQSKDTSFSVRYVNAISYQMVLGGAYILFSPKALTLFVDTSLDENDLKSANLVLMAGGPVESVNLSIDIPFKAAKLLSETFPELKLTSKAS